MADHTRDVPKEVTSHLKALKAAAKDLDDLLKTLKKAEDAPLLEDTALRAFRARWEATELDQGRGAVSSWIGDLAQRLRTPVADAQATFGAALEDRLKEAGLPLRGRWPEWMSGPFRVQARPTHGDAALAWGPGVEPLDPVPLDATAVAERIPAVAAELKARCEPEAFPKRLLSAWRMALAAEGRADGDVPLGDLVSLVAFQAQGPRFHERPSRGAWSVPYDRVQLSYDLARLRLVECDGMLLRLRVATRDQTRHKGPLWLPDDAAGNGTFFAAARFERRPR
ncbi:MAG: hypothetical protein ABIK09_16510 [Pseudomonadota bacterium]